MNQENLISALVSSGWYYCESFLSLEECQNLVIELNSLTLTKAKIGRGLNSLDEEAIRNDSIYWLNESQKSYLLKMTELQNLINRELYLGLKQYEGHFARYEKNGFYKKHLDQFIGNNDRLVSAITYLNSVESGGELRIYSRDNPDIIEIDIKPKAGSFVCFLSNQIYHEVLPTNSERLSITGWLRTNIL